MILIFFSALAAGYSGAMMPGPLLTYTIRQALNGGPKSGFVIMAGHAVLEVFLLALIFLGFDQILKSNVAQIVIGIAGGLLLAAMGTDMIVKAAKNKIAFPGDAQGVNKKSLFLSGITISAANPYFLLWWAVIGLNFVMDAYRIMGYAGVIIYFAGHMAADFSWYGFVSILVGKTRRFITPKPYRVIIIVLGAALIAFGVRFVVNAALSLF